MPSIADSLKLARNDLRAFPKLTVDLILDMQKEGWSGFLNKQGHVRLLAPDKVTWLQATTNKNSHTYLKQRYDAYKKGLPVQEEEPQEKVTQKWSCPRPGCPKVYITEEKLSEHINVDHEKKMKCPDCDKMFARAASLGAHRSRSHGYISPNRKEKPVVEEIEVKEVEDAILESGGAEIPSREDIRMTLEKGDEIVSPLTQEILGVKFDTELLDTQIAKMEKAGPVTDSMPVENIVPNPTTSLKHALPHLESPNTDFFDGISSHENSNPKPDNSWEADMDALNNDKLWKIREMFKAAGLEMEIRVWRA